jgi:hypothetical protein
MDMLRRLLGPWGKGASKEQQQAWLREYDALAEQQAELSMMLIEGKHGEANVSKKSASEPRLH